MTWRDSHEQHLKDMPIHVRDAHKHSIHNREEILRSIKCGCFHCCAIFDPREIVRWVDKDDSGVGQTALCPKCEIDSVVGTASSLAISKGFLAEMKDHWFGVDSPPTKEPTVTDN